MVLALGVIVIYEINENFDENSVKGQKKIFGILAKSKKGAVKMVKFF